MREKFYQMDELARARALQDEAAKLHIPVPVLSYQYEIKDINGNIEEKGIAKSNSYTRNALNAITWFAGLCSKGITSNAMFADSFVSVKNMTGNVSSAYYFRRETSVNPVVVLGIGTNAESLDDYLIPSSDLTDGARSVSSVFNPTKRKMITTISRSFINNTGSSIGITESGVTLNLPSLGNALFIRDVFTAIPVGPGQTITWTYVTEVAYPNP